jgi:hypothetical protein
MGILYPCFFYGKYFLYVPGVEHLVLTYIWDYLRLQKFNPAKINKKI